MAHYFRKSEHNWADELDVSGFDVSSKSDADLLKVVEVVAKHWDEVAPRGTISKYIGSNQEIQFSLKDLRDMCSGAIEITEEEKAVLDKLFPYYYDRGEYIGVYELLESCDFQPTDEEAAEIGW